MSVLALLLLLTACGNAVEPNGTPQQPRPMAFEVVAPPPSGWYYHLGDKVWAQGDTVVLRRHVSLDRRATWQAISHFPDDRLPEDFVFIGATTGVARAGGNAFALVDLAAGTTRFLSGSRDLDGWAVHDGYLFHLVQDVFPGSSFDDETITASFFRIRLDDPAATWEALPTVDLAYDELTFRPSLHATDQGLVAVTRYAFLRSTDGGASWETHLDVPRGLGGALGNMNPVLVTRDGHVLITQGAQTVVKHDEESGYVLIGQLPELASVNWNELEHDAEGHLLFPSRWLRSQDGGLSWSPYFGRQDLRGRTAYLRSGDVYLSAHSTSEQPTLVAGPDGSVEMILPLAPGESGGGIMDAVRLPDGDFVGMHKGNLIRYSPGASAWAWESGWRAVGTRLFGLGDERVALTRVDDRYAIVHLSSDGGATWDEGTELSTGLVTHMAALPDRLLAFTLHATQPCRHEVAQSLDGGAWEVVPEPPLIMLDGSTYEAARVRHVPVAVSSDGIVFGYSEPYASFGGSCDAYGRYATRSDDGGQTWRVVAMGSGASSRWPTALTTRDDLVTVNLWTPPNASQSRTELHRFDRAEERWAALGEPLLDGQVFMPFNVELLDLRGFVDGQDRLYLRSFQWGWVRSVQPVR